MRGSASDQSLLGWMNDAALTYEAEPRLVGNGPQTFSTSVQLETWPRVVWDTNRYYADLGVDVRATRAQIGKAYRDRGGEGNERLTMIARCLLDSAKRRRYDSTPMGSVYVDAEVAFAQRKLGIELLERRVQELEDQGFTPEEIQRYRDLLSQDEQVTAQDILDSAEDAYKNLTPGQGWGWSYFQWRSTCEDTQRLAEWQGLLVEACSCHSLVIDLSVGFILGSLYEVHSTGHRVIALLGDVQRPTARLAQACVRRVLSNIQEAEIS